MFTHYIENSVCNYSHLSVNKYPVAYIYPLAININGLLILLFCWFTDLQFYDKNKPVLSKQKLFTAFYMIRD